MDTMRQVKLSAFPIIPRVYYVYLVQVYANFLK